jgi:hypothetical protein
VKPSIGRVVHLVGVHAMGNGVDVAPAIITRVWSDTLVNVTVFPDCGTPHSATSVKLVDDETEARSLTNAAFWPPRV